MCTNLSNSNNYYDFPQIKQNPLLHMNEAHTFSIVHINRRNPCMLHKWSKIRINPTQPLNLQLTNVNTTKQQSSP